MTRSAIKRLRVSCLPHPDPLAVLSLADPRLLLALKSSKVVGLDVGAFVGEFVVGAAVGLAVGARVGVAVGDRVGGLVGRAVGAAVGDRVGCAVGALVGAADSASVRINRAMSVGRNVLPPCDTTRDK